MSEPDDLPSSEFLRLFKENKAEAMRELYRLHRNAVEVVVKNRLGKKPKERFEDAVQSVWLAVIKGAESFEGRSKVRTWVIQIARNLCASILRQEEQQRRGSTSTLDESDSGEPAAKGDSVPELADTRMLGSEATAVIATFPPEEVHEFLDYYIDRKSCAEIAEAQKVHPNTVRYRIKRALEKLRGLVIPIENESGELEDDQLR